MFEAGSGSNVIMAAYHLIHSLEKLEAEWNERWVALEAVIELGNL